MKKSPTDAFQALAAINVPLDSVDKAHEYLKLLGVVMAQITLLDVLSSPETSAREKVAASRILLETVKEPPEVIAERLQRSPFAHLSMEELRALAEKVGHGDAASLLSTD